MRGPRITLTNIRTLTQPIRVHMPNSQVATFQLIETCVINDNLMLNDVLKILDFNANLISVNKLATQMKGSIALFYDHFVVQNSKMSMISMDRRQYGIYILSEKQS